jgi:glycosyltransferase involved in cell wall biosynthesis
MKNYNYVSVIIPTYNEKENIEKLVKDIARNLKKDYELIFLI